MLSCMAPALAAVRERLAGRWTPSITCLSPCVLMMRRVPSTRKTWYNFSLSLVLIFPFWVCTVVRAACALFVCESLCRHEKWILSLGLSILPSGERKRPFFLGGIPLASGRWSPDCWLQSKPSSVQILEAEGDASEQNTFCSLLYQLH